MKAYLFVKGEVFIKFNIKPKRLLPIQKLFESTYFSDEVHKSIFGFGILKKLSNF